MEKILEVVDVKKSYPAYDGHEIEIFNNLNLTLYKQEKVAIVGPSGCGKSTLLSLLAGLDVFTAGEIYFQSRGYSKLKESELTELRVDQIGIVFQQFHLIDHLNALENVMIPLDLKRSKSALQEAKEALQTVHMEHRSKHFPGQLSGGEKQRVAIARALVNKPSLILADEPTGSLDEENGERVIKLFFALVEKNRSSLLLVTHNPKIAALCDRIYTIERGTFKELPAHSKL